MTVSDIKSQHSVRSVLNRYGVQINRNGFCKCIYHDEKTASMKVYKDSFHSFCCGKYGDIFDIVAFFEGTDFRGAFRILGGDEKPNSKAKIQMYHARKERQRKAKELTEIMDGMRESAAKVKAMRDAIRSLKLWDDVWCALVKEFAVAEAEADYWMDRWTYYRSKTSEKHK